MHTNEIIKFILFGVAAGCILLFPFWYSLFIHYKSKFNLLSRFKFSLLSTVIVYGSMCLLTVLLTPIYVIAIKISPQLEFNGNNSLSFAREILNFSQSLTVTLVFLLVISLVVPSKLIKYLNEISK